MPDYLGPVLPKHLSPLPEPEGHNKPPKDSPPTPSEKQSEFIFEFLTSPASKQNTDSADLAAKLKTHVEKRTKEYLDYGGSTGIVRLIKKIIHIFTGAPSAKYSTSLSNIKLAEKVEAFQADILIQTQRNISGSLPEELSAFRITTQAGKMNNRVDIGNVAKRILQSIIPPAEKPAALIKKEQVKDLKKLNEFARNNKWDQINDPTNTSDSTFYLSMLPSTDPLYTEDPQYRSEYQLTPESLKILKKDPEFMRNYKEGLSLIAESWGWDLQTGNPIENPHTSQKWTNDMLGLRRMVESLALFGDKEALTKLGKFAEHQGLRTWQAQINTALSKM